MERDSIRFIIIDGDTIGHRSDSKAFGIKDTIITKYKPQVVITKITDKKLADSLRKKKNGN